VLDTIPPGVMVVAAAKERTVEEVAAAHRAGVACAGHNYVQEARRMIPQLEDLDLRIQWHMIGHLQRNKVRLAIDLFDVIETVDSWRLAREIDKRCEPEGKVMRVLVEVNSGREVAKTGVLPEDLDELVRGIAELRHIHLQGLMTMGPRFGEPEEARPYFRATREAFERLTHAGVPGVEMRYLSMGMSNSYRVAIEEGANIVRLGTALFGERRP
jgi:pyridoxal phosphate enzyme (YggS family)